MKWLTFTGVCVAALITLGILAVDERNVLWEARTPHCPYCREEMAMQAIACKACRRTVDWVGTTETCTACLDAADVDHMRDRFEALGLNGGPLPGPFSAFPRGYFRVMESGACGYCAGLKEFTEGAVATPCPVCRGSGRCTGCGGDRVVEIGSEIYAQRLRERGAAHREAHRREELTRLPLQLGLVIDRDVEELRGSLEAEEIRDEEEDRLLDRARLRLRAAFETLAEEHARRDVTAPALGDE